ncbi:MAG: hypothetical protein HY343_08755, partial [Lentisphaerae bacterium]|nr:hypothetical protein [Lentisphaerota bacterium]
MLFGNTTSRPAVNVGGDLRVVGVGGSVSSALFYVYAGMTNAGFTNYGALVSVTGDVYLATNAWIVPVSHPTNGGSVLFRMRNMLVSTNAGFNATRRGFDKGSDGSVAANGVGPGFGYWGASVRHTGGGYGGIGGRSETTITVGAMYGSANAPVDPGSSGGSGGGWGRWGGKGGGAVRIQARETINLNGLIAAAGEFISSAGAGNYGGGGSGGGIFLTCRTLQGANGLLLANGGPSGYANICGGGGGGRIAVWRVSDVYSGSISNSAAGGIGALAVPTNGYPGTVVYGLLPDISLSSTSLVASTMYGATTSISFEVWDSLPANAVLAYDVTTNVAWLSAGPVSGVSTGEHDTIVLTCGSATLNAGISTGLVTITSLDSLSDRQIYRTIQIVLNVLPGLGVSPTNFFRSITMGTNASSQSFQIWNDGGTNALYYEIVSDAAWLGVSPTNGTSSGEYDPI